MCKLLRLYNLGNGQSRSSQMLCFNAGVEDIVDMCYFYSVAIILHMSCADR